MAPSTLEIECLGMIISTMLQRKATTPGTSYSATSTDAPRPSKRCATKRLSGQSWSMRRGYGTRPQRKTSNMWRTCSDRLRGERLPSTRQCDHHTRKPELGDPCGQVGGSHARNVVPHYKQLSGRLNIRTHSRSYTHQRQHMPLPTTFHPHRSL